MKKKQNLFSSIIITTLIILVLFMGLYLSTPKEEGGEEECKEGDEGHEGFE